MTTDSADGRGLAPALRLESLTAFGAIGVIALSLLLADETSLGAWLLVGSTALLLGTRWGLPGLGVDLRPGTGGHAVWIAVGLVAGGILLAVVDTEPARFGFAFVLGSVLAATGSPVRRQLPLLALGVVAFVVGTLLGPSELAVHDVLAYGGLLAIAGYLIAELSAPLRARLAEDRSIRDALRSRNRLLAAIERAVDLDLDDALAAVMDAVEELGFGLAHVAAIRDGVRYPVATRGLTEVVSPTPAGRGLAGRALRTRGTVVADDYTQDPDRLPGRDPVKAAVAVPFLRDGEVIGVLIGGRDRPGRIAPGDIALLEILAEHAGRALENTERFVAQQQAVEQLRRLDLFQRDFVANVSHDLRTPLTVVKGVGRTLQERGDALGDDQVEDLLERLNANASRLAAMLTGLLDFSGLDAPVPRTVRRPVELSGLVAGVLERMRPMFDGREVTTDLEDEALATVDPRLIEHVIENLVGNAVKHTPDGIPVGVAVRHAGGGVAVEVSDEGPGIPPDELPRLTERYFRGAAASSTTGTGVGLNFVAQILDAHGSRLEITSRPGRTVFRFVLGDPSEGRR